MLTTETMTTVQKFGFNKIVFFLKKIYLFCKDASEDDQKRQ